MTESLITMQCNSLGWSSAERAAQFGIVSYDWSNVKALWAAAKPMTCEELLTQQAMKAKAAGTKHVFVYRNIVKALPWFETTRNKLDDPAYSGFFLRFDPEAAPSYHVPPCAAENHTHCSRFYHDQEQTPEVPTSENANPDGKCVDYCDCGLHPCGEYLFDHRNGTMLRDFLVKDVVLGALLTDATTSTSTSTSTATKIVDGLFLDDYWCSDVLCQEDPQIAGCPCGDPVQGPTEIDRSSQFDMGLTDEDIRDITLEWNTTMTAIHQALLEQQAYTWSLIPGQENANAKPILLTQEKCQTLLHEACQPDSLWQRLPVLFGFTVTNRTVLAQLEQDLAFFLLARGDYSFAGWGVWGMTWPFNPEPGHGTLPPLPHGVPLPKEFLRDYGEPRMGICQEVEPGVFVRDWSASSVRLDCTTFQANIDIMFVDERNGVTTPQTQLQ
jgi:hypothetical protein